VYARPAGSLWREKRAVAPSPPSARASEADAVAAAAARAAAAAAAPIVEEGADFILEDFIEGFIEGFIEDFIEDLIEEGEAEAEGDGAVGDAGADEAPVGVVVAAAALRGRGARRRACVRSRSSMVVVS
jgi:hypothetical protein